jgi:transcriptional regulator with XRE-family HTH domain
MTTMTANDIGGRVRQAREQRGLSLGDTARLTKLPTGVLRAIEENDFASLPAGMYRKAYLRTVAAEVGLDPLALAADYETQYDARVESAAAATGMAAARDRGVEVLDPSHQRSIVTLAVLATLSVAWFSLQSDPEPAGRRPDPKSATESRVQPASVDAKGSAAAPDIPLKIDLTTTGWCWVAVESDGERVVYGLIEPGKRVVVEGQRRISLRLGDAGSVQMSINDGPRRTAGGPGEVVELEVTPDPVPTVNESTL